MNDLAFAIGTLTIVCLWLAWREKSTDNPRDAKLLAGVAAVSGVGALAALL